MSKPVPDSHPLKHYVIAAPKGGDNTKIVYRPKQAAIRRRVEAEYYRRELATLEKMTGVDYGY